MKKIISLALAFSIALTPSSILAAQGVNQAAQQKLEEIIKNAQSKLESNSVDEIIQAIKTLSDGIVEFEESKNIKSLRLDGTLKESDYFLGEKINLDGIKLIAVNYDNSETEISLDNIKENNIYLKSLVNFDLIPYTKPYDKLTIGNTYLLVLKLGSLYGSGVAYITIKEPALDTISIKSMPKTEYTEGEQLDITGLVIEGTYSDGSKKIIDSSLIDVNGFDSNKEGEQTLTITVDNKETTYKVIVNPKPIVSESLEIERVFYTPKPSTMGGEITIILNEATQTKLQLSNFSVHCPGLNEMTIAENIKSDDNKTYKLSTPAYRDNTYILEIYFKDKTLEENFTVKSDCPVISYPFVTRVSDDSAIFKFNSDEAGTMKYVVRETNLKLRANENVPTENELIKEAKINAEPNEITINSLKANTSYELFYMTSNDKGKSVVYGPVEISSEAEKQSTSNIEITDVKFKMSYGSQLTDTTQDIVVTLSESTSIPLNLENFEVICPAGSALKFSSVENIEKKVYTLKMRGGFYDNNYEIKITFPDGTFTKESARCQLGTPNITETYITRTSEKNITVEFKSSKDGYIYYGFSDEMYVKPLINEVIATAPKIKIYSGKNILKLDNVLDDKVKYFYWLTENIAGNRANFVDGAGKFNKVPIEITQPDEPEKESNTKIEKAEFIEDKEYYEKRVDIILSEAKDISKDDITLESDNTKIEMKYADLASYSDNKEYSISLNRYPNTIRKGIYTLSIKFNDGIAKAEIEILEDVKPR